MKKFIPTLLCGLLFPVIIDAQDINPDEADIHNDVQKATPTITLRADYYFTKGSYLYWEGNYNFNKDYSYLTNNYRIYNQVGYEQAATEHWYFGASVKHQLSYYEGANTLVPKANITHRGKIGSLKFIKELSGEYIYSLTTTIGSVKPPVNARVSLAIGLFKIFTIAQRPFITSLNYRLYLNTNMGEIYKNRRFDFKKFRMDLMYGITKNIYVGIYGMLDSEHFYTLASYDINNNIVNPAYRQNRINPIIGFSCNFVFRQEGFDKEILTGLPFR
jgi:hypothetical protein